MTCPERPTRAAIAAVPAVVPVFAIVAVLLVPAPPSFAAEATETTVNWRIDRVTVFSDCAQVTRVARLDLDQGVHILVFERLPLSTRENTIGCRVDGAGRVRGIRADIRDYGEPIEEEKMELERERDVVAREIEDLGGEARALDKRREFLASIQEAVPAALAENAATGSGASPLQSLKGALGFLNAEWTTLETDRLRLSRARAELDDRHGLLELRISGLDVWARRGLLRDVRIELEVLQADTLDLELSSLVTDASWRLLYDARFDRAAGRVEWTSYGEICQSSGEDWTDVEITLATSDPGRPTAPPVLDPVFLAAVAAPPEPETETALARTEQRGIEGTLDVQVRDTRSQVDTHHISKTSTLMATAPPRGGSEAAALAAGVVQRAPTPPAPPMPISLSGLGATATGTFLRIARRETIPADGSWHQAAIAGHTLPVELEVLAVPRLARLAYLSGRSTNLTGGPLLPGTVRLFSGGDFLGTAVIDRLIAPGAPVTLSFGSFDRVEVSHELLSEKRAETRRTTELRYHYRTRVKNYDTTAHHVVVLDQIPVSTDERIAVEVKAASPPASSAEQDPRGTFRWEEDLPAGGERVIDLEYEVRYPKEWQLAGS